MMNTQDWIARSSVDADVFTRWPDYRVILVAADFVDATALAATAAQMLADAHQAVRTADSAEPAEHTVRWQQAYLDFGVKPRVARSSIDALLRRAASERGLPAINTLVDYGWAECQVGVHVEGVESSFLFWNTSYNLAHRMSIADISALAYWRDGP